MVSNPSPHNSDFPQLLPIFLIIPNLNFHHPPRRTLPLPLTPTPTLTRARARTLTRTRMIAGASVSLPRRHERQLTPRTRPSPRRPSSSSCTRSHLNRFENVAIKQVLRDDKHVALRAIRLHHPRQYCTELGVRRATLPFGQRWCCFRRSLDKPRE